MTPTGVDQDSSRGPDCTPATSDCQLQPQEGQDQCLVSSRATAAGPGGFPPIAGSVFDEAPSPKSAAAFDPIPMDAVMFDDSQLIHAEEEEHRHASTEQPVEAMEELACGDVQGNSQMREPNQARADEVGEPTHPSPAPPMPAAEDEEQRDVQLSLRDFPSHETPGEAASTRDRLHHDEGRYRRSSDIPRQLIHSHQPIYLSSGYHNVPDAEPSADTDHPGEHDPDEHDPADPGEHEHMYQSDRMTQDRTTWEAMNHPKHDSSEHHAPAEGPQQEDWACVLPRVDSAPPVTTDSPDHSSALPNSPSWGLSGDEWGSPTRADTDSHRQSAWDSPPGAAPNSPALACARSRSGRSHVAPRAMSSSPAPGARSPYEAPWHTPPRSQATTPMYGSTPPSEGHPFGGDAVGGLDGDYAYAYAPPPATPTSPSPPASSPCDKSDALRYEYVHVERSWRRSTPASRVPALKSSKHSPASPQSPPHHEGPGRAAPDSPALVAPDDTRHQGEEEHDQKATVAPTPCPQMEAWHKGAVATAADKHDSSSFAEKGASATEQGLVASPCSLLCGFAEYTLALLC